MSNDFTFGVIGNIEPNIRFQTSAGKEVMRIDNNGVTVNSDFSLDEAAQHVINALGSYVRGLVQAEREECAKVCDEFAKNSSNPMNFAENCAAAIRARGNI